LTLYWKNGKVATTDGPYAETEEQLMGLCSAKHKPTYVLVGIMSCSSGEGAYRWSPFRGRTEVPLMTVASRLELTQDQASNLRILASGLT
jgi:hypothetical protein